jgi:hypothetical protein
MQVSPRLVRQAAKVEREAPELVAPIKRGEMTSKSPAISVASLCGGLQIQSMRTFYCCIMCVAVIDAKKIDQSW